MAARRIVSIIAIAFLLSCPAVAQAPPQADPSALTTQQLLRENANLKELVLVKFESIQQRLDAMDKAVQLLHSDFTRVPTDTDKAVGNLKELVFQKIAADTSGIELQFKERDVRGDQITKDSKVAIDAALLAAKEFVGEQNKSSALAIAKQEATFNKQIETLTIFVNTITGGQGDKINDIKATISTILGRSTGIGDSWGVVAGVIVIIIGFGGLVLTISRSQSPRTVEIVREVHRDAPQKTTATLST